VQARSLLKLAGAVIVFCAGVIALAPLYLRNRAVELPRPTGPYPVGRQIEHLRDLVSWIWYPAESRGAPAPYLPAHASPSWFSQNLDAVRTNASLNPPAKAGSPELIFLPADGLSPPYYSSLLEDLASRGYKVVAISPAVKWADYISAAEIARFGVLGHHLGGAAAAEACRVDDRCVAAVDLDGRLWNPVATEGLKRPLLMLLSEPSFVDTGAEMSGYERVLATAPGSELLRIRGMRRLNFTDRPFLFNPLLRMSPLIGSINPLRGATIARVYVSAFFDRYLKNENPPLMQGPSPDYPEVVWRR
jgi:hypothetical protein